MIDFFGRVICPHCKFPMQLERIERSEWVTHAIFKCSSPSCFDKHAVSWRKPKAIISEKVA